MNLTDRHALRRAASWRRWRKLFERKRLERLPRYTPATTTLLGFPVEIVDAPSFLSMALEIFGNEIYRFPAARSDPLIIDGGANIGLSVIYFKRLYPSSRVVAFEADPAVFAVMERNLRRLALAGVRVVNRALWTTDGEVPFLPDGADAGRLARAGEASRHTVPAARLRDLLDEPVDLLKLDVEGAEGPLLEDCSQALVNVERIFVEYHSFAGQPQSLARILSILDAAGFRLHLHPGLLSPRPFAERVVDSGMDMRLNLFGFRA